MEVYWVEGDLGGKVGMLVCSYKEADEDKIREL